MAKDKVDLDEVRNRRYVLKDILNTNLLSPEARKRFESEYAETGSVLEQAAVAVA
jgi:hypothetical protein